MIQHRPLVPKHDHTLSAAVVMMAIVLSAIGLTMTCNRAPEPVAQVVIPPVVQSAPVAAPAAKPLVHRKPVLRTPRPAAQATVPMPTSPVARSVAPVAQPARAWELQAP